MKVIRDWVFSIPLLVAFGLILGIGHIVGLVTLRFSFDAYERSMVTLQVALIKAFKIAGVDVDIEGEEHLGTRGDYVFISNHQSMFDIPIFGGILRTQMPRFVSKQSLAKGIPTVSLYLRKGGNALIDRRDKEQALTAISEMGEWCQNRGVSAVIFPEGTRSRDGSLGDYRVPGAAALLAAASTLPVVPTTIDGSWIVFRNNMFPVPFGTKVRVRLGTPIERTDPGRTDRGTPTA